MFQNQWVSMGVVSDGSYGTENGLVFSFPVNISGGKWSIVQGLSVNDESKAKIGITLNELVEEKNDAVAVCSD